MSSPPQSGPVLPSTEELTIKAGGAIISGWQEIFIERSVERMASAFYLRLTESYPGQAGEVVVTPGTAATVYLSGDLILTGYIDQYIPSIGAQEHTVTLKGRSKTEDLVDSSLYGSDGKGGGWNLVANTIGAAAQIIAKPFGVNVVLPDGDFDIPPPRVFPINPGMTAAQLLEEMARTTGSLVWDDAAGDLVISGVGTTRAGSALVEGKNLEAASATISMDQRFSDYYILGQSYDLGSAYLNQFGHAQDPGVVALGRVRTRVIPWEAPDQDGTYTQKRLLWEVARRYGRSNLFTCRVTGWRDGTGALWTPNSVVSVNSPSCKINADLVIVSVSYIRNAANGTVCALTCMPAAGLTPQPLVIQPVLPGAAEPAPSGPASSGPPAGIS